MIQINLVHLAILAATITAMAHHSFAATYDESKTIEIKGRLLCFPSATRTP